MGEPSGDGLLAEWVALLRKHFHLKLAGVLGPETLRAAEGLETELLAPMGMLSVMGLVEPLWRLPALWGVRQAVLNYCKKERPDVFLGVDAPDFNLGLESRLRPWIKKIYHYVSPSIWAWRYGRILSLKRSVDRVFLLFPFEKVFYDKEQVPATCVGHPIARAMPLESFQEVRLSFEQREPLLGLFMGSRDTEIKRHTPLFLKTAEAWLRLNPQYRFVTHVVNEDHARHVLACQRRWCPDLPLTIRVGDARAGMRQVRLALVASGTATLELLCCKTPMVVAYVTHPITYRLARFLVRVPFMALPNLLSGMKLVPEYLQGMASPATLLEALKEWDVETAWGCENKKLNLFWEKAIELQETMRGGAFEALLPFFDA